MSREKVLEAYSENMNIVDFYPYSVDIEVTTYCNFECRMCPHSMLKNSIAKHMDLRILDAIEPWIQNVKKVSLQGDGEPFLNPQLDRIIEYFEKHDVRLSTTTNLSLFDENKAKLLQNFDTITISCDGCEKNIYESIRKNGNFDVFCRNLELFMTLVKKPNVIVNCVLMRQNVLYAEKMVEFVHLYGIKNLIFSNLLTDSDLKNTQDSIDCYGSRAYECIKAAQTKAKQLGINLIIGWNVDNIKEKDEEIVSCAQNAVEYSAEEISNFINRYNCTKVIKPNMKYSAGKYHCEGICSNLYEKTYIDVDGNVTLCCFGKTNPVGNVLQEDFQHIWNGKIYSQCRKNFFDGLLPDFCIGCKFALSLLNGAKQPYDFRITDLDEDFINDDAFWKNR